ncbi:MAG: glucuronyl hydrolase, partial [Bacteroidia bacterium]|nr:glucuronyl hydrolase [Bacteroidia bacterium]
KVPYFDFDAPPGNKTPRDASSAAIIASALYEFSQYDSQKGNYFRQSADTIMKSLSGSYFSKYGTNKGFLLTHSTGSMPQNAEVDVPLIYADYYYLEALVRRKVLNEKGRMEFNTK